MQDSLYPHSFIKILITTEKSVIVSGLKGPLPKNHAKVLFYEQKAGIKPAIQSTEIKTQGFATALCH